MPLSTKLPLPDNFIEEMAKYVEISNDPERTDNGQAQYTNPRTLASYDTTGTAYDGQGEEGLALLLYNVNPILKTYIFDDQTYTDTKDAIEQSLQTLTPSSGTATDIIVSLPSDYDKFYLEVPATISGANITINGDDLFADYTETENVTELEAGIYPIFKRTGAFYKASSSSGNDTFLQQYKITAGATTGSLLHFDGADASTSFPDETGKAWVKVDNAGAGTVEVDTAESKFGGASVLFSGTAGYIETSDDSDFDFGANDFTIDCWIKVNSIGSIRYIIGQDNSGNTDASFGLSVDALNYVTGFVTTDGSTEITVLSSTQIPGTDWHHVAFVRDGGTLKLFFDGTLVDSTGISGSIHNSTSDVVIGQRGEASGDTYTGWIDELRIINNRAEWTSDFTPPTVAYTISDVIQSAEDNRVLLNDSGKDINVKKDDFVVCEYYEMAIVPPNGDNTVVSLLHMNGTDGSTTFTDEVGTEWTVNGNAQIDTAESKFGGASGLFDGTGDWIDRDDGDDLTLGDRDFTFDFWVKRATSGALNQLMGQGDGTALNNSVQCFFNTNDTIIFRVFSNTSSYSATSTGTITDTNWHHIAGVRDGNTVRLFIDGVADGTVDITGLSVNNSSTKFSIARFGEVASNTFNGHIDEFRFVKGEAKWTTNFTPPTAEYDFAPSQIIPPITSVTPVAKVPVGTATPVDKSTPVQVVNANYDVSGNGGRKIVVLDNGWVVTVHYDSTKTLKYRVDRQDGNGFVELLSYGWNDDEDVVDLSISAFGTNILTIGKLSILSGSNERAYQHIVDALTGTTVSNNLIDTSQTDVSNISSVTSLSGITHEAHASKNPTYPNSFNIRYSKDDGNGNWDAVTQVTTINVSSSYNVTDPSIQEIDEVAFISCVYTFPSDSRIGLLASDLSLPGGLVSQDPSWSDVIIYSSGNSAYVQEKTSIHKLSDNKTLGVAWHGFGASHVSTNHIFFDESSDKGVTWSGTPTDLGEGDNPSLTKDDSDNWVITYERGGTIYSRTSADNWVAETTRGTGTNPNSATYEYFTAPLTVFDGGSDVQFTGVWDSYSEFDIEGNNKALIDGTLEMNELVIDNLYEGFVSKVNRWETGMEGAGVKNPMNDWSLTTTSFDEASNVNSPISRGSVTGSGWIVGITNGNSSNGSMTLFVDGSPYIGDTSGNLMANHRGDSGSLVMIRYETGFEFFSNLSGLMNIFYVEGDVFEEAIPKVLSDNSVSATNLKVNVTGEGWFYGGMANSQGIRIVIDGVDASSGDRMNSIIAMFKFNNSLQIYTASSSGTSQCYFTYTLI